MPVINVKMIVGRTEETKKELVSVMTSEAARILKVKPESVTVIIDEYAKENWAEAGQLYSRK